MNQSKNPKNFQSALQFTSNQSKMYTQFSQKSNKLQKMRNQLKKNKANLQNLLDKINTQVLCSQKVEQQRVKKQNQTKRNFKQKIVNQILGHVYLPELLSNKNKCDQISQNDEVYYKSKDSELKKQFKVTVLSNGIFYPPSCSAYDLAYCKKNDSIYAYGGISCTVQLEQGLKQYFYHYQSQCWKQIKPVSLYTPMPRYGHTLTATNQSLLLFGGVSEYKQKLKDRCFYPDVWLFNIQKSSWKLLEFTGPTIKPRKSHSACMYNNFYIVHGGIDDCQQIISQISWVNLQQRKSKWRTKKLQYRFNHQIAVYYGPYSGRDYLFLFGGRNKHSQIISQLIAYHMIIVDGELQFRQGFRIVEHLKPCQFPMMTSISDGILIMGGIDQNNQPTRQCWYFSTQKQSLQPIKTEIDWNELRGAKCITINRNNESHGNGKSVYILSGSNSKKYKAIKINIIDDSFS